MQSKSVLWCKRLLLAGLILALLPGCMGLPAGLTSEPVMITFTYLEPVANYQPLAEEFHRLHPNITVELKPIKVNQGGNPIDLLANTAKESDAVRIATVNIPEALFKTFLPLDTEIAASQNFPKSDLFQGSLEAFRLDGKQIGLPAGLNPFVVYYNQLKFKANKVTPPPANWTLDGFTDAAVALNHTENVAVGSPQYMFGFCTYPTFPEGALFTYLFGGGLFDSLVQVSKPTLNQQANVEALEWYASLKNNLKIVPPSRSPREVGTHVWRGNCGFWVDFLDRSNFGNYDAQDLAPLPLPAHVNQFNIATADGYFVMAQSEHPDETWQWIEFLMEQQSASGSLIPPTKKAIASNEYAARVSPETLAVARSLPQQTVILGIEMYRNARFGKVLELYAQATTKVFNGDLDAQTALNEAQQKAEESFK